MYLYFKYFSNFNLQCCISTLVTHAFDKLSCTYMPSWWPCKDQNMLEEHKWTWLFIIYCAICLIKHYTASCDRCPGSWMYSSAVQWVVDLRKICSNRDKHFGLWQLKLLISQINLRYMSGTLNSPFIEDYTCPSVLLFKYDQDHLRHETIYGHHVFLPWKPLNF